jgi:GDP-4-dehydro-6-deoxy-D-mannose reductase
MRALVTGATGFVGHYQVKLLLQHGYNVCGTYFMDSECEDLNGIRLEKLDVTQKGKVKQLIKDFMPDEIYHLAAISATSGIEREMYYNANFLGAYTLLDAAADAVPSSRVLIMSSANAYGQVLDNCQPIMEDQELRPVNHYAAAKAAADMAACAFAADGLHIVRARPFNHTGPGQNTGFVCSRLAKLVAEVSLCRREPVIDIGNIESARDFTDVRDVVEAYRLLLQKGRRGEAYNICSQKMYSIKEVINILTKLSGVNIKLKTSAELLRKSDIPVLLGSREKIYNDTGWEPKIPFEDTLKDLLSFWEKSINDR